MPKRSNLDNPCPTCDAEPGYPCKAINAGVTIKRGAVHMSRTKPSTTTPSKSIPCQQCGGSGWTKRTPTQPCTNPTIATARAPTEESKREEEYQRCIGRIRYNTVEGALAEAQHLRRLSQYHTRITNYQCTLCGGHHVWMMP